MSEQTPKDRKQYLIEKYGKEIFEVTDQSTVRKGACIPHYPSLDEMLSNDSAFAFIDSKLDHSYDLTERSMAEMKPCSRRDFLKRAGVVLSALTIPLMQTNCENDSIAEAENSVSPYEQTGDNNERCLTDPTDSDYFNTNYPQTSSTVTDVHEFYCDSHASSVVGITGGNDIEYQVRRSIELAGGLNEIEEGHTVCIKPNNVIQMVDFKDPAYKVPTCTNPEVLRHVIRAVKEKTDAKRIFVAERAALGSPTLLQMMLTGIYDVCIEEGVNILPWENRPYKELSHDKCHYLTKTFKVPESIDWFDHFINVPVLKNHEMVFDQAEFTASIKAFVGVLHPNERMTLKHRLHEKDFCEKICELNLSRPNSTMNIIDATEIVISGGPAYPWMKFASPGVIIASKDRVACDSAGVAVLKYCALQQGLDKNYVSKPVMAQRQLKYAAELGLGYNNTDRIEMLHENIDWFNDFYSIWSEPM
jgi:uncharacterized protein (DUF362 family)